MKKVDVQIFVRQVQNLTYANLKSRYRGTWTGFLWVILNPIIMFGAQSYAFNYILKIQIPNYALFLLSGLLPWLFLNQTVEMGSTVLINHGRLLKSFPIHPLVILCAQVLENFINFLFAFLFLVLPAYFIFQIPVIYLLLTPFAFVLLVLGVIAMSSTIAILQVFYRDLRFVVTFLLSISFFFTPIFYDKKLVPENMQWLLKLNLFYYFISPFRTLIHGQDITQYFWDCLQTSGVVILLATITMVTWKRSRNKIYTRL